MNVYEYESITRDKMRIAIELLMEFAWEDKRGHVCYTSTFA